MSMYRRVHGVSVPGFVDKPCVRPVAAPMPSLSKLAGPSPFSAPSDPLIQVSNYFFYLETFTWLLFKIDVCI